MLEIKETYMSDIQKKINECQNKGYPILTEFNEEFIEVLKNIFKNDIRLIDNEKQLLINKGSQEVIDFIESEYNKTKGN